MPEKRNKLYFGDNLPVLQQYIPDESVDLIYLDPPFNSKRAYNILFAEKDGTDPAAQIKAFGDTWHWDQAAEATFACLLESDRVPARVSELVRSLVAALGRNDVTAYLVMMAVRLVELKRVLKATGSLYLHCDPTASHHLKVILDGVFGVRGFRNEIVWKRASTVKGNFGQGSKLWSPNTDSIFFYTKGESYTFKPQFKPYSQEYIDHFFRYKEPDGRRYRLISMIGPGGEAKGNPRYECMGITRCWRYSKVRMNELLAAGMVIQTKPGVVPQRKLYLDKGRGVAVQSLWDDIESLGAAARERLGYPTQKPEALLDRIIRASSNEGDIVLDPFCGCGTSVAVAQRLCRRWIGIDITHLAIALIRHRLADQYGEQVEDEYEVHGVPVDVESAKSLAQEDRYQFQWWALELVGARPVTENKGADRGIDGCIYFFDEADTSKVKKVLVSVKSGHVGVKDIRDLGHVLERENAQLGFFVTLEPPTQPMTTEALSMGSYETPFIGTRYPRMQILTIESLLAGQKPERPPKSLGDVTFKKAPPAKAKSSPTPEIF